MDMRDDKNLTRIANLLRQAEGTDNEHEAATFLQAAQRLATAASIDLAVARAHDPSAAQSGPTVRQVTIGSAGKRGLKTYVALFVAIGHANDLKVDVAHNSTFVMAYGFPGDIDDGGLTPAGGPAAVNNQVQPVTKLSANFSGAENARPPTQVGTGTQQRCSQTNNKRHRHRVCRNPHRHRPTTRRHHIRHRPGLG